VEPIDTLSEVGTIDLREPATSADTETITKKTADKKPWESQGRKELSLRPAMTMRRR
jgi:hypothetical protein